MQAEVLTDTVEHHHRVVDIMTDHRQDSAYERLVNLQGEAYPTVAQREQAYHHRGINSQGHDRTDGEAEVAEAEQDVQTDEDQSKADADEGVARDILSH